MIPERYIIAGVDFSACSLNALTYTAALCHQLDVTLVVAHAYHPAGRGESKISPERHAKKLARRQMKEAVKSIEETYRSLRIEIALKKDADPVNAIIRVSEKYHAELIAVGTQGAHESADIFIGGTTGSLIKLGNAPILAIPNGFHFVPFAHVLFAVKHPFVASQQILTFFLLLLESFHPEVEVLHVTRDSMPDLSRFPNPYPLAQHAHAMHTSDSHNIYQSVQTYLQDRNTDLLVVVNRLRGFFEGLFAQSGMRAALFNIKLPILVLHGGVRAETNHL